VSENQYFAFDEKYETELNRLRALEQMRDPLSIRHLETVPVSQGWNCLVVGAGAGSMAKWLANRVGPDGKVVATDIDTRFLSQINIPNLEIRRHDILKDDLETDHYDLVLCRLLLAHLPEPENALRRMANAIRPGGWILVEESDFGSIMPVDDTNPDAVMFSSVLKKVCDIVKKKGIADVYFGRRVHGLVEKCGFVDLEQEGVTGVYRGGEGEARILAMTAQAAGKPMVAAGLITQEQYESIQHQYMDPNSQIIGATFFASWGRKPLR
jgi:SAM-dependent methyltransferase